MKNLVIRPFQETNRDEVVKLWTFCSLIVPQNDPHRDIDRKVRVNSDGFLIGNLADKVVATCMVGYDGHRGWINYLAVHPDQQRRGFATQIMAEAVCFLDQSGCPKINLQVRAMNTQVIAFYESLGFSRDNVISLGKRLIPDH